MFAFFRHALPLLSRQRTAKLALFMLGVSALAPGCGNNIGDNCKVNQDCSFNGDRVCDTSQPGGYCTAEACSADSPCPSEATCVRFYPTPFLNQSCDPTIRPGVDATMPCGPGGICLPSAPDADESTPAGVCAPRASERRLCMFKCSDNGDCRGAYECRVVGSEGSQPIDPSRFGRDRFCAPRAE